MQLVNIVYFITAISTAVAIPATTESEASTRSVDYDPIFPTAQILHTTLTDCSLDIKQCARKAGLVLGDSL